MRLEPKEQIELKSELSEKEAMTVAVETGMEADDEVHQIFEETEEQNEEPSQGENEIE